MFIKDNKIYELDHRAYFLKAGGDSSILAASDEGKITIIDLEDSSQTSLNLAINIREISFQASKKIISVIDNTTGNLIICDFQGRVLFWEEPKLTRIYSHTEPNGFLSCHFDQDEQHFWCVTTFEDFRLEIQLRQIDTYSIIDAVTIEDPFGGNTAYSFHSTNRENLLSLWGGAGQDGQKTYWLQNDSEKIICKEEFEFIDTTPPAFSPDGSEFLVIEEDVIYRYKYPSLKIGSCEWQEEDSTFGYYLDYLDENYALVCSNEGRTYLINIKEMVITEELFIENHTPQLTFRHYSISQDNHFCTDLSFFERLGKYFAFVYPRDKNAGLKERKDSLLIIPIEKILSKVVKHDGEDR